MIEGKTASGFAFTVDPSEIDDIEFLERLGEAGDDITKMPAIMKELLGAEQRDRMYDFLREKESGKVRIGAAIELFQEILTIANEANEGKN